MRLLLTSSGLTNKKIWDILKAALAQPLSETVVFFIPTAINQFRDSKVRQKDYLSQLENKVKKIHTVDLASDSLNENIEKLKESHLIYVSGGNPYYLLYWFRKSGFAKILSQMLIDKVYLGISAGSMIVGREIPFEPKAFSKKYLNKKNPHKALGFVTFCIEPHYLSSEHPDLDKKELLDRAKKFHNIYALDDQSALFIEDSNITVISEGTVKLFK